MNARFGGSGSGLLDCGPSAEICDRTSGSAGGNRYFFHVSAGAAAANSAPSSVLVIR